MGQRTKLSRLAFVQDPESGIQDSGSRTMPTERESGQTKVLADGKSKKFGQTPRTPAINAKDFGLRKGVWNVHLIKDKN